MEKTKTKWMLIEDAMRFGDKVVPEDSNHVKTVLGMYDTIDDAWKELKAAAAYDYQVDERTFSATATDMKRERTLYIRSVRLKDGEIWEDIWGRAKWLSNMYMKIRFGIHYQGPIDMDLYDEIETKAEKLLEFLKGTDKDKLDSFIEENILSMYKEIQERDPFFIPEFLRLRNDIVFFQDLQEKEEK